jgi:uncharacterized protein (TIGR00369 family)
MIWKQPAIGGYPDPAMLGLPGIDRLRMSREGRAPMPPIAYLTEMPFRELSEGHVGFEMPASEWFANSAGVIPGGFLCTIADAALGAPIHSRLGPGVAFTTAELSLTMLRPVHPDPKAKILGSGHVIHLGRSVALSEAFLFVEGSDGGEGSLVAHGTSRCSVFPPMDPIPEPPADLPVLEQPYPGTDPSHPLRRAVEGAALPEDVFQRMSGLEILQAQIAGELQPPPPIHFLTGIRVVEAEEGSAAFALPCSPWLSTSMGTVQGGFTAMLADFALTGAAFTGAEAGTAVAPLDFKVNFLRPVYPDMRDLTAEARIEHRGRTLAISSCRISNADGKPVALATGTSMYLPGRPASLAGVEQLGSSSEDAEDERGGA